MGNTCRQSPIMKTHTCIGMHMCINIHVYIHASIHPHTYIHNHIILTSIYCTVHICTHVHTQHALIHPFIHAYTVEPCQHIIVYHDILFIRLSTSSGDLLDPRRDPLYIHTLYITGKHAANDPFNA